MEGQERLCPKRGTRAKPWGKNQVVKECSEDEGPGCEPQRGAEGESCT